MGKINVLSFEIANLIAAGEVVERPASVLKELIENSIDSGATSIVAEIKRGGVALIRVTDNGCGIDREDLPVALKRHATSKIRDKEDLNTIATLGFRGEALAAISSVSALTIISKTEEAESGTMLVSEAGEIVDISEVGAARGTTVVVENLFYNVPARRKFLKKDSTEAMNVTALVEKVALSRPDISIQLLVDGEERFKTPGNSKLIDTIYSVFGRDFSNKLIETSGSVNGIKIHGYIGRSDNVKKNRNLQNIFINGRYVKSLTAMAAIEKAYTSYIAPECFPTCVLFIEMNPAFVDVNVHPAKLEVKFSDERVIFEAIYYTVKSALEEHEYRPELELSPKRNNERAGIGAFVPVGENNRGQQFTLKPTLRESKAVGATNKSFSFSSGRGKDISYNEPSRTMTPRESLDILARYGTTKEERAPEIKESTVALVSEELPEYKIIGEAFDCYVLVEFEGSLLVVDKHAAHERVIFEDLKRIREADGRVATQTLMLPISVSLSADELSAAEMHSEELYSVGFEFSLNGRMADIMGIPDAISTDGAETLFVKMLDEIIEGKGNPRITEEIRREKTLYQIACKAAIKGGRVYDRAIIEWLVKKLLSLPDITVCPHGRPVAYKLTKTEFDRQFDRIK